MNHGRYNHSSCCLGRRIFVFGSTVNTQAIESLKLDTDQAWTIIVERSKLGQRTLPAVAVINSRGIAVFGGFESNLSLHMTDGYVLDTELYSETQILKSKHNESFLCFN